MNTENPMYDIADDLILFDTTKWFTQPVKKELYPNYYADIKNPIDLSTIKAKARREDYKTVQDFLKDIELLVNNSVTFNGSEHEVTS